MTIQKFTQSEGSLEVLRGKEAHVLNDHFRRLGKTKVSDFSEDEKKALDAELEAARRVEDESKED